MLITSKPFYYVYWYVASPSDSGLGTLVQTDTGYSTGTEREASLSYTFASNAVSGAWKITAVSKRYSDLSQGSTRSYTVSVSSSSGTETTSAESTSSDDTSTTPSTPPTKDTSTTPTVTVPVWSNIPDPYNLTVGDSFHLDLSSYVTGSPTFTRNGGVIPAGLRFSNGVISGTVTSVESRLFRFTATNSAGVADSEWIKIVVTNP